MRRVLLRRKAKPQRWFSKHILMRAAAVLALAIGLLVILIGSPLPGIAVVVHDLAMSNVI